MYAIIQTGGKQYRVEKGDIVDVELLQNDKDSKISFNEVILFADESSTKVGSPHVKGCQVEGKILGEVKGPKVISFKYKRRKNCRRKVGHRQTYSRVEIVDIKTGK